MTGWPANTREWLGAHGSPAVWRTSIAVASGALTAALAFAGLISWAVPLQAAVLVGIAVGLVAPTIATSAAAAVASCVVGALLVPGNPWALSTSAAQRVQDAAIAATGAAAIAVALKLVPVTKRWIGPALVGLAIAIVLANMWGTPLSVNGNRTYDPTSDTVMPSFNEQLAGNIPERLAGTDDAWFYKVYRQVGEGGSYYKVFNSALKENPLWSPRSVVNFRLPTFYMLSRVVPAASVPVAFLVLASVAVLAAVAICASLAKLPLAIPACAALASYFVFFPMQLHISSPESTAAATGVIALACGIVSYSSKRWRALVVASACLAVLAALTRETIVFLVFAGFASSFFAERPQRRFRLVTWSIAILGFIGAYAAHYVLTRPMIVSQVVDAGMIGRGSLRNVVGAITYATDFVGGTGALPWVLAAVGLLGVVAMPDTQRRMLAAIAAVLPLVAFFFVANNAWYETTGETINYWGATAVPLLYALIPVAFTVLPGASAGKGARLR